MTSVLLSVVFLLAGGQPPTDAAAQQQQPATQAAPAEAKAEPKMICKYESITGSRVQKQKICRPENAEQDGPSTALQRQLNRFSAATPPAPGMGN